MNCLKLAKMFLLVTGVVFIMLLGTTVAAQELYLKYNVHTQVDRANVLKGSYANYTNPGDGHTIIPAGTKINITKKTRRGFFFSHEFSGQEAFIEYHQRNMGMDMDAYIGLITSTSPVTLSKLSATDQKGVKEGRAIVGMTRDGILAALGYPASHRTPSLESSRWIYWQNRFRTLAVDFGADGKVSSITN